MADGGAQGAPPGDSDRDVVIALRERVVPAGGSRHGLVVGVEKHRDSRLDLKCARADAEAMYGLMTDPECGMFPKENVRLLLDSDATKESVWRALSSLRRAAGESDTVWIYYAGHAAPEGECVYWVTHDADVDDLYGTGLGGDLISKALSDIRAARLVTFLDCCHAAAVTAQKNPTRDVPSAEEMLRCYHGRGRVTIASSDGKEKSVELGDVGRGAFTYFLEKGLRGEADADGDGVVTADEMWAYLQGRVTDASRKAGKPQTPVLMGEMTHGLALTLNPLAAARKKRIAEAIGSHVGIGAGKLTTEQGECCLRILREGAHSRAEKDVAAEFEALADGKLQLGTFKRLVAAAMHEGRSTGAIAELEAPVSLPPIAVASVAATAEDAKADAGVGPPAPQSSRLVPAPLRPRVENHADWLRRRIPLTRRMLVAGLPLFALAAFGGGAWALFVANGGVLGRMAMVFAGRGAPPLADPLWFALSYAALAVIGLAICFLVRLPWRTAWRNAYRLETAEGCLGGGDFETAMSILAATMAAMPQTLQRRHGLLRAAERLEDLNGARHAAEQGAVDDVLPLTDRKYRGDLEFGEVRRRVLSVAAPRLRKTAAAAIERGDHVEAARICRLYEGMAGPFQELLNRAREGALDMARRAADRGDVEAIKSALEAFPDDPNFDVLVETARETRMRRLMEGAEAALARGDLGQAMTLTEACADDPSVRAFRVKVFESGSSGLQRVREPGVLPGVLRCEVSGRAARYYDNRARTGIYGFADAFEQCRVCGRWVQQKPDGGSDHGYSRSEVWSDELACCRICADVIPARRKTASAVPPAVSTKGGSDASKRSRRRRDRHRSKTGSEGATTESPGDGEEAQE